jgi:phage/plasmid-like protein (TIGR03299 family)
VAHKVEMMFSANRVVPWHGLGRVIEEAPDSVAAIKLAGLEWEVRKRHIQVEGKIVDGFKANVRSDNGSVLGIVTDRYQIVQNNEAFAFTDALITEGEVRYETAGSLKEGRQIWMAARLNREYNILGDKVDPYLVFTNSHDGSGAIKILMTPIRVVCANTLNLAMRQASRSWSSKHIGDMSAKMHEAQRTLGLASTYMDKLDEEANSLVDIRLTSNTMKELLSEIFPTSLKDSDRKVRNIMEKREGLLKSMKADDLKQFQGTGWQVINGVTDFLQHSVSSRTSKENKFTNIVEGDEILDKTYQLLRKIA